jgi:predicted site-specific integrase-resolvase
MLKILIEGIKIMTIKEWIKLSNTNNNCVILYARVSSSENKDNLKSQLNRLRDYSSAKGYNVIKEIKEIGSELNDKRKQLESIITI